MEMLQLNDLHKTFNPGTVNEKVALNGVSLHMEAGDFATIVGSNGAGKSTMFNAITGGFIADEGSILLGGQDITFVGYPSATGNNNVFRLGDGLCISSTCKDKDGAWSFVRTLFTKEFQEENRWNGLPTNADVFNAIVKDMMTLKYQTDSEGNYVLDENGQKIVEPKASYWFEDDRTYDIDVFTQEQIDQVMDLYNKTNLVMTDDQNILGIVKEETAGYFAGQKSLDDTVRLIQNRVSLYVAEQK